MLGFSKLKITHWQNYSTVKAFAKLPGLCVFSKAYLVGGTGHRVQQWQPSSSSQQKTACTLSLWFNDTQYSVLSLKGDGLAGERSDEGLHAQSAGRLKGAGSNPFRDRSRLSLVLATGTT